MRAAGAVLIAAIAASGCFIKPDRPGAASDAARDGTGDGSGAGSGVAPVARMIAHSHYSGASGGTNGTTHDHWGIPTTGINKDDLVLFFANIDNGTIDTWAVMPLGFTKVGGTFYGSDGQSYVGAWKKATASEPTAYEADYTGGNIISSSSVVMLVAVTGYDTNDPIDNSVDRHSIVGADPVPVNSQIVTHKANDLLVVAAGADWQSGGGADVATTPPPGFTKLDDCSDQGGTTFTWTTEMVAAAVQATPGDTGQQLGALTATPSETGEPWTVVIAIAPAP